MGTDSSSGISLTDKDGVFARNKHMIIRKNYAREAVEDKIIRLVHRPTAKMHADFLTKIKSRKGIDGDISAIGMIQL